MRNNQNNFHLVIEEGKLIKRLNNTSNKFNNEAFLYKWLNNHYVVRKIGKQYNLNAYNLAKLEKNLNTYYRLLKINNIVNVPKTFLTKIDKQQKNILLVTEYFPKGKVVEVKNVLRKIKFFKKIAKLIIKLSSSNKNSYLNKLIYSIDPNPDNFFIGSNDKIIYNDFTPPLYYENKKWVEFRRQDELDTKKSDKEKRYFTGFNLLLIFINKTRIQLPFTDYLRFVVWLSKEIEKSHLLSKNNIRRFPEVFNEIYTKKIVDFSKVEKYAVLRDLLRFSLSFNQDLTNIEIKEIYKNSKKLNGVKILTKEIYAKNQNSNSRIR